MPIQAGGGNSLTLVNLASEMERRRLSQVSLGYKECLDLSGGGGILVDAFNPSTLNPEAGGFQ